MHYKGIYDRYISYIVDDVLCGHCLCTRIQDVRENMQLFGRKGIIIKMDTFYKRNVKLMVEWEEKLPNSSKIQSSTAIFKRSAAPKACCRMLEHSS